MNSKEKIMEKLNHEQSTIINSKENYILVSACPGSGKTYTIVKKIEKELENIDDYQGIIACSFTKEASEELKCRINKKYDLSNCFVGTIDSFIKNIICKFINRALVECGKFNNQIIIDNNIYFNEKDIRINDQYLKKKDGKNYTVNEVVRFYDQNERLKQIGNLYYEEWIRKIQRNEYEISFPTYFFASYIVKMEVFKNWFNNKYTTIYIDEAQDLNYFQHYFFEILKNNTNIKIVMVGDPNQSIYQFRGARPELFRNLIQKGYKEYKITVSLRCDPSITYFANRIYNINSDIEFELENNVIKINGITDKLLNDLRDNTFILVESNKTAQLLYEEYKDKFDIVYTRKINFDNREYNDYYTNRDVIDELLKYYLNYDNVLDKYKYPFEKIEPILFLYNARIRARDFLLNKNSDLKSFLIRSAILLNLDISEKTINIIVEYMENTIYKYNYYLVERKNRIMTIHSSKGLENDNVIIYLDNHYDNIDSVFKNQLFVAITRAKKKVFIISLNNSRIEYFINRLLKNPGGE